MLPALQQNTATAVSAAMDAVSATATNQKPYLLFVDMPKYKPLVSSLAKSIHPDDLLSDPSVHGGRSLEDDPHVTLLFGMSRLPSDACVKTLQAQAPLILTPISFGVFETKDKKFDDGFAHSYDTLYIKFTHGLVLSAWRDIAAKDTDTVPEYEFVPHMTIAYLRAGTGAAYASHFFSWLVVWPIHYLTALFVRQQGQHKRMQIIRLGTGVAKVAAGRQPVAASIQLAVAGEQTQEQKRAFVGSPESDSDIPSEFAIDRMAIFAAHKAVTRLNLWQKIARDPPIKLGSPSYWAGEHFKCVRCDEAVARLKLSNLDEDVMFKGIYHISKHGWDAYCQFMKDGSADRF